MPLIKEKTKIIINAESLETRVAALSDGKLIDYHIERQIGDRVVGSIFKGTIQNLQDGLQAAFVDIGLNRNAFIHYWDMIPEDTARLEAEEGVKARTASRRKRITPEQIAEKFSEGDEIIVQVVKDAIGTKGPRVTANLSIPGRYLVMLPGSKLKGVSRKVNDAKERQRLKKILSRLPIPDELGLIVRTASAGARKVSIVRDIRGLVGVWGEIEEGRETLEAPCRLYQEPDIIERMVRDSLTEEIDRIYIDSRKVYDRLRAVVSRISRRARNKLKHYDGDTPIFEHFDVERQIAQVYRRKVWLKSGGYIIFDETEALVAVDVNTGRHKGASDQSQVILEVNCEAALEAARQLKLRNVGGLVVIDFVDMRQRRHQNQVYRTLKQALKADRARTNVLPISSLGLVEMTRQRVEESVRATAYSACAYCHGRGMVKSALTMSVEIQRHIGEILRRKKKDEEVALHITVNPHILERLRSEDEMLLVELEKKLGGRLTFISDSNLHIENFTIVNSDTEEEYYSQSDG